MQGGDQVYELPGQILKYKRLRNVAVIIAVVGLALFIAGAVMLGVGIHKSNKKCVSTAIIQPTCPPAPVCTTPATAVSSSTDSPSTSSEPPQESTSMVSPLTSSPCPVASTWGTCPPCSCTTTTAIPSSSTTTPVVHPVTVGTTHKLSPNPPHAISTATTHHISTSTLNYPNDPTYYPCLSHLVIVFEAATNLDNATYVDQINFITKYLIHGKDKTWTNPERIAYAAFERGVVHWKKFYHFNDINVLQKNIEDEKRIFGLSGYKAIFDVLVNNITLYDTEHQYVNTIIFTSNDNADEIHAQYDNAVELSSRGQLLIVTTKAGINNAFTPWTNGDPNRVLYMNQQPPAIETYQIIKQFKCPTLK